MISNFWLVGGFGKTAPDQMGLDELAVTPLSVGSSLSRKSTRDRGRWMKDSLILSSGLTKVSLRAIIFSHSLRSSGFFSLSGRGGRPFSSNSVLDAFV